MNNNNNSRNKITFRILTGLIPIVLILLFEGTLRIFGYGESLNLFIPNEKEGYEDYLIVNPKIGKKYFQKFRYTSPANDIFLKEKPDSVFRVFVMGSSTVYGFPYQRNLMFSRILHKRLEQTYPNKHIEVVNTAITAINSFTLLDYSNEILEQKPNAILIYAGHNEFYGAFGIGSNETMSRNRSLTKLHLNLMSSKLYQLLKGTISGISSKIGSLNNEKVKGTLMKRIVNKSNIIFDGDEYNTAMSRYYENMDELLAIFSNNDIPVFFSEVVSNIKDLQPFNSIETDEHKGADNLYKEAQEAEHNKDYAKALELYTKAKDYDCIRFRASEDINTTIKELAQKHELVFIPMTHYFQNVSENKLIGNNLMTEHVHPNIDGSFLMAEVFFMNLVKSNLIESTTKPKIRPLSYFRRNWGYSELDSLVAIHQVELLKSYWPFTKENNDLDHKALYTPKSYIDSVAFSVIKFADINMLKARLYLAEEYTNTKQYLKAAKEYDALLCTNPNNAENLRDAATISVRIADIPKAIDYYKKSLKFEKNYFAYFKIGELLIIKGDYNNAVNYFRKAYTIAPDDVKNSILMKTYVALLYANRGEDAKKIGTEIKKTNPNIKFDIPQKKYIYTDYVPLQIRDYIIEAIDLWRKNKLNEAISVLKKSKTIYETPIANRYLGEIFYQKKELKKSYYHLNDVYAEYKFDTDYLQIMVSLYLANNDKENARNLIQEINSIHPNHPITAKLNSILNN